MAVLNVIFSAIIGILICSLGYVSGSVCLGSRYYEYQWAGWSSCSSSCGGGSRLRHCHADNTHEVDRCNTICYNGGDFYSGVCHCPPGTINRCCDDIPECASHPCQNGGTCNEGINQYTCTCPPGTTNATCDDILECASDPCMNGGTCNEFINFYTCNCVYGTTGPNCDDILECNSHPCLNGGTCLEYVGYYTCVCPAGTTDKNCVDIPECASNPCQNGATCNEFINYYNCTCKPGYTGYNCELDLFSNHDNECRRGGHCYIVFDLALSWDAAKDFCEARQGYLVVPNDLDEQVYLENYLQAMRDRYPGELFWIGGTKAYSNSPQWLGGDKIAVDRWPAGVSSSISGTECMVIDGQYGFEWSTRGCDNKISFICEEIVPYQILG